MDSRASIDEVPGAVSMDLISGGLQEAVARYILIINAFAKLPQSPSVGRCNNVLILAHSPDWIENVCYSRDCAIYPGPCHEPCGTVDLSPSLGSAAADGTN